MNVTRICAMPISAACTLEDCMARLGTRRLCERRRDKATEILSDKAVAVGAKRLTTISRILKMLFRRDLGRARQQGNDRWSAA